jgi:hypothetical protein
MNTLYTLHFNFKTYGSTDIIQITGFALSMGMLGQVEERGLVDYEMNLQLC